MPFQSVEGLKIYFEQHGDWQSGQDTVLLLHGLGSSSQDWENQIPALSKIAKVLAVDLRGHGKSDKPDLPYNIPMFAEDISKLVDKLKLEPVHLIGHSMGGMIAFQLALDHPQQLKTLTIVNSAPQAAFPSMRTRFNFYLRSLSVKWFGMKKLSVSLARTLFPKPEQSALREIFIQRWCENDSQAYLNSLQAFQHWDLLSRLKTLTCPTLIITGDRDYTPVAYKQFYCQLIQNVQLVVIKDSGHLTIIDQVASCNQAIIEFILKNEGTK